MWLVIVRISALCAKVFPKHIETLLLIRSFGNSGDCFRIRSNLIVQGMDASSIGRFTLRRTHRGIVK